MSAETKEKTFEFPMMPIYGLDLGRDLGSIDARLNQLESDNRELKRDIKALDAKFDAKLDAMDAKFEAKTDKMANALHRLDERTRLMMVLGGGLWVTVIAGFILQYFK